jgi:FixJ family two-component response regulator
LAGNKLRTYLAYNDSIDLTPLSLTHCDESRLPEKLGASAVIKDLVSLTQARPIVVIDDNEDMREMLTLILETEGHPIVSFANGEAFLQKGNLSLPICVFLDIVMPGRSGIQIMKELNARRYEAPVFLMSAWDDTPTVIEALKNGAQDFLTKPFDPYAAVQKVRDAVELWSTREEKKNAAELIRTEFPGGIRLTRREAEVLTQLIKGVTRMEIAKSLGMEKRNVDNVINHTLSKFKVTKSIDLVRIAMSS